MKRFWRSGLLLGALCLAPGCSEDGAGCPEGQVEHGDGHCHVDTPVGDGGAGPTGETGFFATRVRPLLDDRCATCHGPAGAQLGLVLGPAPQVSTADVLAGLVNVPATAAGVDLVEPGDPARSWLYLKVTGDFQGVTCRGGCGGPMPPAGDPFTAEELETLRQWIANGARED